MSNSFEAYGSEVLRRVETFFAPRQTPLDLSRMDNMSQVDVSERAAMVNGR
jgi:hypothetical protein